MSIPSHLLTAITQAVDRYKRTLEQPGLVSVKILVKFDADGSPVDCFLTPEFQILQSSKKVPRLSRKQGVQ